MTTTYKAVLKDLAAQLNAIAKLGPETAVGALGELSAYPGIQTTLRAARRAAAEAVLAKAGTKAAAAVACGMSPTAIGTLLNQDRRRPAAAHTEGS